MATKREVMIAGVPARLSHMLASDTPAVLTVPPGGSSLANAAPLETNFVALTGALGAVELPAATGQYLHVILNVSGGSQLVYPNGNETINNLFPGQPAVLPGGQLMIAVPSRQQWAAGTLNVVSGASLETDMAGPLVIGTPSPTPPAAAGVVVANQYALRPNVGGAALGAWNMYYDQTNVLRYLDNGPAATFVSNVRAFGTSPQMSHLGLVIEDVNSAGPGAPVSLQSAQLGIMYGSPGQPSQPLVYSGVYSNIPWPMPRGYSFMADQIMARSVTNPVSGDGQATVGLNFYRDPTGNIYYTGNGSAAFLETRTSVTVFPRFVIGVGDNNLAGPGAPITTQEGVFQCCYAPTGQFVVVGAGADVNAAFANVSVAPRRATLVANQMVIQPDVVPAGSQIAARLGFNMYLDNTGAGRYLQNGPAAHIATGDQNPLGTTGQPHVFFNSFPSGTAGQLTSTVQSNGIVLWANQPAINQSAMGLNYSSDGTTLTLGRVMVGNAGTGPGGVGRTVYIV